ncbi:MAG: hypothetical protein WCS87_20265 [Methylococcaceae bacterium]
MALLVLACIGCGKEATADEWAVKGSLIQQLQYNDNMAFSTTDKKSVVGYLLTPNLQATRKTEVLDIGFQGQGLISRYDDSSWDCNNYNLGLNNAYRTKRSVFGLNGGYSVSCSYTQQITQTGILVPNNQSTNYRLAPSWTWQWTSRDQLNLTTNYSKTSYSNLVDTNTSSTGTNFSGNDTYTVNLGGSHQWSRRITLNGRLNFSNIQYTGSNASTQNLFGFQVGGNYTINQNWAVNANAGPIWVDTRQSSNGVSSGQNPSMSLGNVANLNLSYQGQITTFSTGYSNSVSPSSIGQTLQTRSVFANYSYRLSPHLLLDIASSFSRSESIGNQSIDNTDSQFKRSYFTASPGIAWELEKNWRLRGSYIYRWQDYQQDNNVPNVNGGTSDANLVMLSLNYAWDGIRNSR